MSTAYQQEPIHDQAAEQFFQGILDRSATDMPFRARLVATPREAIAEHIGVSVDALPDAIDVRFVENTARATFVLPEPRSSQGELGEAELEAVAGGCWWLLAGACVALVKEVYEAYQDGKASR